MAWQLANEPRPMKRVSAYRGWLDSVTSLLKELAPRQLVTIGSEGSTPFPKSYVGIDFESEHAHPRIDYATVHVWPQNWEWYAPEAPDASYEHALNKSLTYAARARKSPMFHACMPPVRATYEGPPALRAHAC